MEDQKQLPDDGYMNEEHMAVIERSLHSISGERDKLRASADALKSAGAEEHLVQALRAADGELERVYKQLFQSTYFHVSDEQMAGAEPVPRAAAANEARPKKGLDVPEPDDEMRLFKAEEASDSVKP